VSPHTPSNPALDPSGPALDSGSPRVPDVPCISVPAQRPRWRSPGARRGLLAVGAGSVLWGTTGVVARSVHAATGLSGPAIGCYRLAVAALVLAAVRPVAVLQGLRTALLRPWSLLASGAGLGLYQALYFLGVQEAGVGIATLVSIGVAPVVTTGVVAVGRRRLPEPGALTVLAVALGGLALVALPGVVSGQGSSLLGVLASLGSGTGYGVTVLVNRRVAAQVDALTMTVVTSGIGALVLAPAAMAGGRLPLGDTWALLGLVYVGAVCTALAYWLFYAGLRTTAGEVAVVVTLLEPLTATALAVALLGEPLSWPNGVGGMLMLVSIAVLYLRPQR
jgi:drug/metabolite transporter (DMT)-like permease